MRGFVAGSVVAALHVRLCCVVMAAFAGYRLLRLGRVFLDKTPGLFRWRLPFANDDTGVISPSNGSLNLHRHRMSQSHRKKTTSSRTHTCTHTCTGHQPSQDNTTSNERNQPTTSHRGDKQRPSPHQQQHHQPKQQQSKQQPSFKSKFNHGIKSNIRNNNDGRRFADAGAVPIICFRSSLSPPRHW